MKTSPPAGLGNREYQTVATVYNISSNFEIVNACCNCERMGTWALCRNSVSANICISNAMDTAVSSK